MVARFVLGTAQIGNRYGITNDSNPMVSADAALILDAARQRGIAALDTAPGYGESERVLGECGVRDFEVITKVPTLDPDAHLEIDTIPAMLSRSLGRLDIERCYGLLLHHEDQLLLPNADRVFDSLVEAKAAGLTEHIGLSVYSPAKLQAIAERYDIDFFQAPANVFDRRFLSSDIAELIASRGLEFHARSIFLQGILAGTTQSLPKYFSQWDHLLSSFHQTCDQHRLDANTAAIQFVASYSHVDRLVVGVANPDHVMSLPALCAPEELDTLRADLEPLGSSDLSLINPSNWPTGGRS